MRPVTALGIVLFVLAAGVLADYALDGGFGRGGYTRVRPDAEGIVRVETADLTEGKIRFFRFLNPGNQEVKFFVARDRTGVLQVAFDASESHAKAGRGFRLEDEWVVNNYCDTPTRLAEVNRGGGGDSPVPLAHRLDGTTLVLEEAEILRGWRLFH